MALTDVITSFDLHEILGGDFDTRRTKAYVTTNVVNGTLMDTSTGETRLGDQAVTIAAAGTGSFTTWAPGADGNPISWQTSLVVDYPRAGHRDRTRRTFGPYTITGTSKTVTNKALTSNVATITTSTAHGLDVGNTVTIAGVDATFNGTFVLTAVTATTVSYAKTATDVTSVAATGTLTSPNIKLTSLEEEQAVPAEYLTQVTDQLDVLVASAQTAETNAETAQAAAEAAITGLGIGTTTTGAPGTPAAVTLTGTAPDRDFNFTIPEGEQGLPGPGAAAWTAAQAVVIGSVRQAPDGSWIKSTAARTTGATFDATEQTFWTTVSTTAGTLEAEGLTATFVPRGRQLIDVRDWGVIGDGTSRALSTLYGSLAAAQADYPQATALTNELDWAALQSMSYANPSTRFLIPDGLRCYTNLPVDVRVGQCWQPDGEIFNAAARNTPSAYMDQANVFRVGNMHPAILKAGSGYTWPTVGIDTVSAGQSSVTVTTPGDVAAAGVTLSPGDFVIVRSDATYADVGTGRIYDYQQFNKVVSWTVGTGVLVLERPIPVGITSGKLCINDGNVDSTTAVAQPWWMADQVVIEGHGMLYGASPFGFKMGAWKPRLSVRGEFQDAASLQAFVAGDIEVRDSLFTGRLGEVKFAAQDSSVNLRGDYVYSSDVASPATTISIGEQSNNVKVNVTLTRGNSFPSAVNALEVWAQGITVRGAVNDYAAAGQQHTYAVKSTDHTSRPPSDIDLSGLHIMAAGGRTRYGLVGDDAGKTGVPTRIATARNVRTPSGAVPTYNVQVGIGTEIDTGTPQGDAVRVNTTGSGEVPQNGSWLLASLAPVAVSSISASTDTVGATSHGLGNGQAIRFTSLTGGTGLATGTTYYVVNRAANTFQVAATPGGSAIDITVAYTAAVYALVFPPGETPYGTTFTMTGIKSGDLVLPTRQNLLTPTAGALGDLSVRAEVTASNTVSLYVNNHTATDVAYATGAPFWVYASWQRRRT